jgi:hypothetical protein
MAIVIGASTQVTFGGACVASANWGYNPNTQRVYCIGEWSPDTRYTTHKPQYTLSLTVYAPSGQTYNTEPTTPTGNNCFSAGTITATIVPAACGDTFNTISGDWFVTGYSYSKDDGTAPGQESWSLMRYATTGTNVVAPTYIFRGITEGQASGTGGGADNTEVGVLFNTDDTPVESQSGNVSAGGFGKAYTMFNAVVRQVGNGTGDSGFTGQGSASIPYTPLYL